MPLPELTTDTRRSVEVNGRVQQVSGQLLIVLPLLAPIGRSRGRRYRVKFGSGAVVSRVVLSVGGYAALRPADSTPVAEGETIRLQLRPLRARRTLRAPNDLQRSLDGAEVSLAATAGADVQHLLLMVAEAKDPVIRSERIRAAVAAVQRAEEATE